MANYKKNKNKEAKYAERTAPISFILYNYSAEKLEIIQKSVSRIHKDFKASAHFYLLGDKKPGDLSEGGISIKILPQGDNLVPELNEVTDEIILIPADRIVNEINFNDFFKEGNSQSTENNSYSTVLFRNQPPYSSGCFILRNELYNSLYLIKKTLKSDFEKDLNWHLERLCAHSNRFIIEQDFPFTSPVPFYKKIKLSIHPIKRWVNWNAGLIFDKKERFGDNPATMRFIFILLSFLILMVLPVISFNAGISGDEEKHEMQAEKVYNYFQTSGADTSALSDPKYKLNFYSQSFDLLAFTIAKKFHIEKIYELRHVMNGFIGALTIITTGILLRFLAGNFAGILTLLFLFFSPRFLGHAMNNPLDIPFAFGYIFTIYHIYRFLRKLPAFSLMHSFWIFFGIAFTISIRIGGLVLIPYFLMFSGLYVLFYKWPWKFFSKPYLKFIGKGGLYILIISIAGYFISLLPWPYALQNPVKNPFAALNMMENITVSLRVMFEGKIIWSDNLPWYYLPKNMMISIPIIIFISFIIPIVLFFRKDQSSSRFWLFMLYFSTIFPVAYIIYKGSNVYGGWRHVLFIYPSFVALSVYGLSKIRTYFNNKTLRIIFSTLLIASMIQPAIHIFRNYPLQYIFFNKLVGGVDKAYKKYETDYYLHSLKPGTDWIKENLVPENPDNTITIISNAPAQIMQYYYKDQASQIKYPYTRYYDRGLYYWDYAIFYCNYIDPYHLKRNLWPPKNTIHEIKVDNVVVCAIVKRENLDDYTGIKLVREGMNERDMGKMEAGLSKLENAIKYDPNNEIALLSLARAYISVQQYDLARQKLNALLNFYPNYDKALNAIGYSFLSEGDMTHNKVLIDKAISIFSQVIKINYKFVESYHNLGLSYLIMGDDNTAFNYFEQALSLNSRYKQSYYMIADILERRGDVERARQIVDYANSL